MKTPGSVPLILLALLAAVGSGYVRIGWSLPLTGIAAQHGHYMVACFLASLVMLERAVTFRSPWVRLLPMVNAASIVAFLAGAPLAAQVLLLLGSTGFLALCVYFLYKHRELYYYVFVAAAFSLLTGNAVFLRTGSYPSTVGWWMAFLLLTIVAERLELSKFLPRSNGQKAVLLSCLAAFVLALLLPGPTGNALLSLSLAATGVWLLRYDMARQSARTAGAHRYSGVLLLGGFCWLLATALLLPFQARLPFGYDAVLHSFFIGFVFSMIFSHAPIILPAILKRRLQVYHPFLYVLFGLLQLSLLARVVADVMGIVELRKWAGMLNGAAILLFLLTVGIRTARQLCKA